MRLWIYHEGWWVLLGEVSDVILGDIWSVFMFCMKIRISDPGQSALEIINSMFKDQKRYYPFILERPKELECFEGKFAKADLNAISIILTVERNFLSEEIAISKPVNIGDIEEWKIADIKNAIKKQQKGVDNEP